MAYPCMTNTTVYLCIAKITNSPFVGTCITNLLLPSNHLGCWK
jgi:hypothetical protein